MARTTTINGKLSFQYLSGLKAGTTAIGDILHWGTKQ